MRLVLRIQCLGDRVLGSKSIRRPLVWALQALVFGVCGFLAFVLRFDLMLPPESRPFLLGALPVWILTKTGVFRAFRLDHGWWRYVSVLDIHRLLIANIAGSVLSDLILIFLFLDGFPRSVYLLDFILSFLGTAALRVTSRILRDLSRQGPSTLVKRVLVYGAGEAGALLVKEIRSSRNSPYYACGFVDDNQAKWGLEIAGVPVLGPGSSLPALVREHKPGLVLIAIPSASGQQMAKIMAHCCATKVAFKTVPSVLEIVESRTLKSQIREVAVEDLLGRTPVRLEDLEIRKKIQDRVVAVTGAGGSIGSELCRQIGRFGPRAIVGYEIAETALFELELEMKARFPGVSFCPEIGSVQDLLRLREVLECHQPSILYHAAAYKHVPMMEAHMFEALENNVFGTYATAVAAGELGVEDFVMISTDKAVRPTSVMGVTKRLAELAVNSLQDGKTRFVSVRFGNVLGSNGSVIPLFKRQIAAGGPVTVTHPEMQRYFMTIPEAVQLVLQASTMGGGGEIFVLDMGEPVKILDLARNLILLSGLHPDKDIRIEFTGVRPGEKLYEELHLFEESTAPTCHEKIKTFTGPSLGYGEMRGHIEALRRISAARDVTQLVLRFKEIVPDYNPSAHVLRCALKGRSRGDDRRTQTMAVGYG